MHGESHKQSTEGAYMSHDRMARTIAACALVACLSCASGCAPAPHAFVSDATAQRLVESVEGALDLRIVDLAIAETTGPAGEEALDFSFVVPEAMQEDAVSCDRAGFAALAAVRFSVPETMGVGVTLRFLDTGDSTWWHQQYETREYWCRPRSECSSAGAHVVVAEGSCGFRRLDGACADDRSQSLVGEYRAVEAACMASVAYRGGDLPEFEPY